LAHDWRGGSDLHRADGDPHPERIAAAQVALDEGPADQTHGRAGGDVAVRERPPGKHRDLQGLEIVGAHELIVRRRAVGGRGRFVADDLEPEAAERGAAERQPARPRHAAYARYTRHFLLDFLEEPAEGRLV